MQTPHVEQLFARAPGAARGLADRTEQQVTTSARRYYKDFAIHAEFWASNDANSGIFVRCIDANKITTSTCYEVDVFDQRKDPSYGTGAVVDFAEVEPKPKAGGKWNTFEITAKGRQITVMLNGQKTVEFRNNLFKLGPITLQYGSGVIEFRKVAIKPL